MVVKKKKVKDTVQNEGLDRHTTIPRFKKATNIATSAMTIYKQMRYSAAARRIAHVPKRSRGHSGLLRSPECLLVAPCGLQPLRHVLTSSIRLDCLWSTSIPSIAAKSSRCSCTHSYRKLVQGMLKKSHSGVELIHQPLRLCHRGQHSRVHHP
jgi:hypothetical protein